MSQISSAVSQDQFLQLLVTQLQNQDPLNPVSDRDFIAQLAQLNTLESLQTLNASFAENLKLQQMSQGTNLIGRTVEYRLTSDGESKRGTVGSLAVQDSKFVLRVGTDSVPLDQVITVL